MWFTFDRIFYYHFTYYLDAKHVNLLTIRSFQWYLIYRIPLWLSRNWLLCFVPETWSMLDSSSQAFDRISIYSDTWRAVKSSKLQTWYLFDLNLNLHDAEIQSHPSFGVQATYQANYFAQPEVRTHSYPSSYLKYHGSRKPYSGSQDHGITKDILKPLLPWDILRSKGLLVWL